MKSWKKSAFGLKVCLDELTDIQQRAYTLMLEADRHGMVEEMEYEIELRAMAYSSTKISSGIVATSSGGRCFVFSREEAYCQSLDPLCSFFIPAM